VNPASSPRGWTSGLPFALAVAGVLLVYVLAATQRITLPGVYMDAVNPDYLVAKVLNRAHAEPLIAWVLPGNYIANRFPVLVSLYHGMQQFWLALPLYALFGMSVLGVRLTHMVFAIGVLVCTLVLLRRARVPLWIAALCGCALAVDPAFIFAFRTQSYITMSPVAWLLLSIALLAGTGTADAWRVRRWIASGVCFGFAVLGYFVYAFYLPAMLLWVAGTAPVAGRERGVPMKPMLTWLGGVAAGCAYYVLGYALVAHDVGGGLSGFLAYLRESSTRLGAFSTTLSFGERVAAAAAFVESVFSNGWHDMLMFGAPQPHAFDALKMVLLIALPVLMLAYAELRRQSTALLRLVIALPVSFFAISLSFGSRLGGHHYMSLLPLAYIALALGLAAAQQVSASSRAIASGAALLCFGALAAINVAAALREFATLDRTGGVGLYSDAVNRLATDVGALPTRPLVYFPDWGLSLPVILISGGTVPASAVVDAAEARRRLCSGRDVAIAIVGAEGSARFASWARDFGWSLPRVTTYAQRDGAVVAQLGLFSAAERDGKACG
jgi:hypothetical protein